MIISDKYKIIFIRIPKTGSTSVEKALIKADPGCISSDETKAPYGHFSAKSVKDFYHISDYRWNEYFKFCTVREPLDWYMSMYLDYVNHSLHKFSDRLKWFFKNEKCNLPFNPEYPTVSLDNMLMLHTLNSKWYAPTDCVQQVDWINHGKMDLTIDFKNLEEGWKIVKDQTGIEVDLELLNKGPIRSKAKDAKFSEEAKKVFSTLHSNDIEFYNNLITQNT